MNRIRMERDYPAIASGTGDLRSNRGIFSNPKTL